MNLEGIHSYFRACKNCGLIFGKIDLYCRTCWIDLNDLKTPNEISCCNLFPLKVVALWNWIPGEDNKISKLIYSIKEGRYPLAYEELAWELGQKIWHLQEKKNQYIFVPAPPKSYGQQDHGFLLAKELSKLFTAHLWCPLERVSSEDQKSKTRKNRKNIKMKLRGGPLKSTARTIIFVDDVITTGSTAMAAHQALGKPAKFEVWTLAERSPLRQ